MTPAILTALAGLAGYAWGHHSGKAKIIALLADYRAWREREATTTNPRSRMEN